MKWAGMVGDPMYAWRLKPRQQHQSPTFVGLREDSIKVMYGGQLSLFVPLPSGERLGEGRSLLTQTLVSNHTPSHRPSPMGRENRWTIP